MSASSSVVIQGSAVGTKILKKMNVRAWESGQNRSLARMAKNSRLLLSED